MLTHVSIRGLGPHASFDADIDATGRTVLHGPSESGKSVLIEAICFALWGRTSAGSRMPGAWVRDGCTQAVVELIHDGRRLQRTLLPTGKTTQSIDGVAYSTAAAFARAIGSLGDDETTARVILAPLAWVPLAAANARPLRDLLIRILPAADPAPRVRAMLEAQGLEVHPGEEHATEAAVARTRRDARKERDRADGRRAAAQERVEALRTQLHAMPATPWDADAAEAWRQHDLDLARHRGQEGALERARARLQDYRRRAEALGPRPAPGPDTDGLHAATKRTDRVLLEARSAYRAAAQRHAEARERREALSMADACDRCGRPIADRAALRARLERDESEAAEQVRRLLIAGQTARAAHDEAVQRHERAAAASAAVQAWERGHAALGAPPKLPAEAPAPTPPKAPRPAAGGGAAALQQRRDDLAAAEQRAADARALHERLATEADRLDALLHAVRTAPSLALSSALGSLADLGPVELILGENPAVTVLIDGRPWWLASRGRQVVADAALRNALRRATAIPLPIALDNVQDVGGQPLPALDGPWIELRTTDDPALVVRGGSA